MGQGIDNGMHKILNGLYLGSIRDSRDNKQIEENQITHILSIHDWAKAGRFQNVKYHCIKASDNEKQDIKIYFSDAIEFIHRARIEGGNVLVHCWAGKSRSATITVAYIMTITQLSWNDAINTVKGLRSIVNPNVGFLKQLVEFEGTNLKREKENLILKFGELKDDDHEYCTNLLVLNKETEQKSIQSREIINTWNKSIEEKINKENEYDKEEIIESDK